MTEWGMGGGTWSHPRRLPRGAASSSSHLSCVFPVLPQVVWQWKVTQAVCQALRGKKDFPVLGAGLEPSEPPTCRCGAYTFRAEGRFFQATYEGEWYWGRPHGK